MIEENKSNTIQRLKYNHYAIEKAFLRLKSAIKPRGTTDPTTGILNDKEIYAAIGEMLLWVMNANQWYKDNDAGYKESNVILGLKHAFNALKHNMDFIEEHQKDGGFTFNKFSFPFTIPPITIVWGLTEKVSDGKRLNQERNYKKHLEGRDILDTFQETIEHLNEAMENLNS